MQRKIADPRMLPIATHLNAHINHTSQRTVRFRKEVMLVEMSKSQNIGETAAITMKMIGTMAEMKTITVTTIGSTMTMTTELSKISKISNFSNCRHSNY